MTPLFSFFFGLCVGSFLNVCLFRWNSGGNVVSPPSFCPQCKKSIKWFDNIPVLSFILLKGRCRYCDTSISWQYPLVELATGILFCVSAVLITGPLSFQLFSFVFVSFLIVLTIADLKWKLLPHPFTNLFALAGLIIQLYEKNMDLVHFYTLATGFVLIGALVLVLIQIFPEVLGGGDIKMVLALSIWLGVMKVIYVLILAFGSGAVVALGLLVAHKINRKSTMPFGPFLALASYGIWFFPELFEHIRMVL